MAKAKFNEHEWELAKAEAQKEMTSVAKRKDLITYTDLANEIQSLRFEPQDPAFHKMLGEISTSEHQAGRGMLTAVVVRAHDGRPGPGFFRLARDLGERFKDPEMFWAMEVAKVCQAWSGQRDE